MTVTPQANKILLQPSDLEPLVPGHEIVGVFNPGAVRFGDEIILLIRVAEQPKDGDENLLLSPRAEWEGGTTRWVVDSFASEGIDPQDPRKFDLPDGTMRLRFISHLRLVHLNADGTNVKRITVIDELLPREPWEELGLEDARITNIDGTYYISYVAISRTRGVVTALMTTRDFQTFQRHGIIFPTENKDVVLLPQKWDGKYLAFHRPVSNQRVNPPSIETALSPDTVYWGEHDFLFGPRKDKWDAYKIGVGPPPVLTHRGWLLIYHGVSTPDPISPAGRYCVGAALLAAHNPRHLLARTADPLICPEKKYEQKGYVPNVIFPTGAILSEDHESLLLFNGAADEVTTVINIPVNSILANLIVDS